MTGAEKRPCRRSLGRRCHLCGASASTASRTTIDHGLGDRLDRRHSEGHAPKGSFLHASISETERGHQPTPGSRIRTFAALAAPWSAPASGCRAAGNRLAPTLAPLALDARKGCLRRHCPRATNRRTCLLRGGSRGLERASVNRLADFRLRLALAALYGRRRQPRASHRRHAGGGW